MKNNELENRISELELELGNLKSIKSAEVFTNENLYRLLFENSLDGFAYCKMIFENDIPSDFIYLFVNPAFEKITGLKNVIDCRVTDVMPDTKEKNPELIQIYGSVATTGEPQKFEINFEPLKIWLSISVICPEKGYFIAIFDNITERKQSEQALRESEVRFKFMFQDHKSAMLLMEPNSGKIVDANKSASKFYNYSIDELKEMTIDKIVVLSPEQIEFEKSKAIKGEQNQFFFSHKLSNGEIRQVEIHSSLIEFNNQQLLFSIIDDITDRKQAELKIQQQNVELQKLNADKDRFLSILAHDLKSPFSSLLGFSELLIENIRQYDIDKIESQINIIYKSAHNIFTLLEDLLMWARSQSGKLSYNPNELNFTEIYSDILAVLKPNANAKNITINHIVNEEIKVYADIDMFKTILRNLVSNAIKFTKYGGRIDICASQTQTDITISVSDTGIGIAPEILYKLFDITQIHTTTGTADERGTGLGLLLCKEFVEKHGGKIWVETQLGQGSVFKFSLPIP